MPGHEDGAQGDDTSPEDEAHLADEAEEQLPGSTPPPPELTASGRSAALRSHQVGKRHEGYDEDRTADGCDSSCRRRPDRDTDQPANDPHCAEPDAYPDGPVVIRDPRKNPPTDGEHEKHLE